MFLTVLWAEFICTGRPHRHAFRYRRIATIHSYAPATPARTPSLRVHWGTISTPHWPKTRTTIVVLRPEGTLIRTIAQFCSLAEAKHTQGTYRWWFSEFFAYIYYFSSLILQNLLKKVSKQHARVRCRASGIGLDSTTVARPMIKRQTSILDLIQRVFEIQLHLNECV